MITLVDLKFSALLCLRLHSYTYLYTNTRKCKRTYIHIFAHRQSLQVDKNAFDIYKNNNNNNNNNNHNDDCDVDTVGCEMTKTYGLDSNTPQTKKTKKKNKRNERHWIPRNHLLLFFFFFAFIFFSCQHQTTSLFTSDHRKKKTKKKQEISHTSWQRCSSLDGTSAYIIISFISGI